MFVQIFEIIPAMLFKQKKIKTKILNFTKMDID
jgi:hypothetical protein